ncbi:hypothetical protein M8C21_031098 [Ambrosia artemisiifolia]|uniref:Uncharacterized protein n=1 Tax=Ambrosia artemisiifolia TaxID=4212 RepID=A0AAD5CDL1_AMBAR|nr:hypothetical protein M8C21_031098 [Ambrosia artemisiifolia]
MCRLGFTTFALRIGMVVFDNGEYLFSCCCRRDLQLRKSFAYAVVQSLALPI